MENYTIGEYASIPGEKRKTDGFNQTEKWIAK